MREFRGFLEPQSAEHARIHIEGADRAFVDFRRLDAIKWECSVDDGRSRWVIMLADDADVSPGVLTADEWNALFVADQPRFLREAPSMHNSFCRECTSQGVSHGVCCP